MKKMPYLLILFAFSSILSAQSVDDFTLTSVTDKSQFTLSDAKGKYVALHFLLKTECPICLRHTRQYYKNADKIPNVVQVFIKPDKPNDIKLWASNLENQNDAPFPIYRDANANLAKKLKIPDDYAFHGQHVHYPALILIDKAGKEVFRYIGKNNRDRYAFKKLVSKIEKLENQQ